MSPNTKEKEVKNSSQDLHETKFDFFFFLIKKLGRRGRPEWLSYLGVTIVAPYPLGPEGTGES